MATGLFTTLIVGTILAQIGSLIPGNIGTGLTVMGKVASALTGAGIGVGVAYKFKESPMVILSAATAGMVGAFASKILTGSVYVDGVIYFSLPSSALASVLLSSLPDTDHHMSSPRHLRSPHPDICAHRLQMRRCTGAVENGQ